MEMCIFCRIVAGNAHGHFVYKDQYCTAFLDIDGFNPGHALCSCPTTMWSNSQI